jgi:hypothetical protein
MASGLQIGAGLAQGLASGFDKFLSVKSQLDKQARDEEELRIRREREKRQDELQRRGALLQEKQSGFDFDPESGGFLESPYLKEKRESEASARALQNEQLGYKVNEERQANLLEGPRTQAARQGLSALLKEYERVGIGQGGGLSQSLGNLATTGTASDIESFLSGPTGKDISDLAKQRISERIAASRQNAQDSKFYQRLQVQDERDERKKSEAEEKEVRTKTQALSKSLEASAAQKLKFGDIEKAMKLPVPLEDVQFDDANNAFYIDPKSKQRVNVDIPGFNVPLVGRVSSLNSQARRLSSAIASSLNVMLKERSGSAVSENELRRFQEEFQSGRLATEAELVFALQRVKNALIEGEKEIRSGYGESVNKSYDTNRARVFGKPGEPAAAPATAPVFEVLQKTDPRGFERLKELIQKANDGR